jgi:hypothetical protein
VEGAIAGATEWNAGPVPLVDGDMRTPEEPSRADDRGAAGSETWTMFGESPPSSDMRSSHGPRPRGWFRRRTLLLAMLLIVSLVVVQLLVAFPWDRVVEPGPGRPAPTEVLVAEDPLQRRVLAELGVFTSWLEKNKVEGYIGEIGIPNDGDERWIQLAEQWFRAADEAGLWVDVWSTGEWWGTDYAYSPFVIQGEDGPVAVARPAGELLAEQAQLSDQPRGVNLSGAEFGAAGGTDVLTEFSNENPGVYGRDYHYDDQATFDYLASQGLDTVRLPFRWERIQPELSAEFDRAELGRLRDAVRRADSAGIRVILDVHNFGAYHAAEDDRGVRRAIGSDEVSREDFADLWARLSDEFADEPGVLAYDLMNEPVDLPSVDGMTPTQLWEAASQDAVHAIRAGGDDTLIMVPGYWWSHAGEWAQQHPRAWIDDSADNIRYAAHHYWRPDDGRSYDTEVAHAAEEGF